MGNKIAKDDYNSDYGEYDNADDADADADADAADDDNGDDDDDDDNSDNHHDYEERRRQTICYINDDDVIAAAGGDDDDNDDNHDDYDNDDDNVDIDENGSEDNVDDDNDDQGVDFYHYDNYDDIVDEVDDEDDSDEMMMTMAGKTEHSCDMRSKWFFSNIELEQCNSGGFKLHKAILKAKDTKCSHMATTVKYSLWGSNPWSPTCAAGALTHRATEALTILIG